MAAIVSEELRRAIVAAVKEAESKAAAEIVVVMRAHSGTYRDVHYAFGFCFAVATWIALLYLPRDLPHWVFGTGIVVGFIVGSLLAAALSRSLVSAKRQDAQVDQAAHAAFYERGVMRTTSRSGILVFLSLNEQRARVLPDVGVRVKDMGDSWKGAVLAIEEAAHDPQVLPIALRALGVALAEHHPRKPGAPNELPDEPSED